MDDKQITPHEELTSLVEAAKTDKQTLNKLLHDYMPFIKKCVSTVFFDGQSKADNITDAMLAFTHSVQTYNSENGAFIQYATKVIRNRLIDSVRKEVSLQKRFFSFFDRANNIEIEADISLQAYNLAAEEQNLRLEIEVVNEEFTKWGFSWEILLKKCPKQERSRRLAFFIAQTVLQDPILLAETLNKRQLPVTRLSELFPKKSLEKYRQYIVALIILSQGNTPYIYSFVPHSLLEDE